MFACSLPIHRTKLDSRSNKCIFLGFKQGVKGYILYDIKTRNIFISRDTVFSEHIFPYQSPTPSPYQQSQPIHHSNPDDLFDYIPHITDSDPLTTSPHTATQPNNQPDHS